MPGVLIWIGSNNRGRNRFPFRSVVSFEVFCVFECFCYASQDYDSLHLTFSSLSNQKRIFYLKHQYTNQINKYFSLCQSLNGQYDGDNFAVDILRCRFLLIIISSKRKKMCRIILKQSLDLFPSFEFQQKEPAFEATLKSSQLSFRSNSSQRSKYISTSRLTKSKIFSAIEGKKTAEKNEKNQEINTQISILQDLSNMNQEKESDLTFKLRNEMKTYKRDCRKFLRALEHY